MANFVFNVAKGRVAELYNRVDLGDPAAARLVVLAINTSATDAVLKDLDTLALVLGDASTAEVTNTGYARKVLAAIDLAAMAPDDTNDRMDVDIPDQTWTVVAAGTNWTDLIICYTPDSTGLDSTFIPLTCHDFVKSPNGTDIVAVVNSAGFFRAS